MNWTSLLTPSLGATGLLVIVVLMVLRGTLVPRRVMDDLRADKDAQISTWKTAYETSQRDHAIKDQQITALMEATRTTTNVVAAMSEAAGLSEGNRHVVAPSD
jgi:hypothetical protein